MTGGFLLAAHMEGVHRITSDDNLIVRMQVPKLTAEMMELKDNSGYFFEYDSDDIMDLFEICNDTACQTISYLGDKNIFRKLLSCGVFGIDRIVPVGKTMDFNMIWDGYNLFERLTRIVSVE